MNKKNFVTYGVASFAALLSSAHQSFGASLPDLIVTSVSMSPSAPTPGQAVKFSAVIKNQGAAATASGAKIGLALDIDGKEVNWSATTNSLAVGSSTTLTSNGGPTGSSTWTATSGSHTLLANVNDTKTISESNTSNNTLSRSFTVSAPSSPPPASTYPVAIPAGAASYSGLEQESGWAGDADSTISPNPPSVHTINQSGSPVKMTLDTKGTSGKYTGWMAKKTISIKSGQLHMLVRASYTFSSVSGIQAWEMGRRLTNVNRVTDNGQTQLVPLSNGELEFDIVPSSSGGWKDTGCRFPTFVTGKTYEEELYYVNDSNGALSLMYVSLNGSVCTIPSSYHSISGASQGWGADEAVVAFQPDANPSAVQYNAAVTMSAWMW